ncbi:Predicted arabinose efflux permease, MFS family [Halogranum amylolyticum]|uniref:Predicted arabinose efflux permease, MFS family n=1 Tax=Halogranum amylolyticum TaxID=660520 RepID=A0A1H8QSG6_9EURY|nr:MFS transporter [Halogranum amylolyticum]SEO56908.1 Predicted arabinose efflux permease, MFS family [Halogranum amylolyticum]
MNGPEAATVVDADPDAAVASRRRALAAVIGVVFIDLLGFGIVIPILPFYVRSFLVSDVFIGLLAASYSLMQFLFAPLLGRLSDERGRRPVLMLSLVGSVVAWTVFGLAGEFSDTFGLTAGLTVLFLARMVAGAMGGNIATAQAYIADITPPERRAGALGLIGASFGLGFVFGPALGGVFASDAVVTAARGVFPSFVPATRFSLPSFAAAGLSLLSLASAALFLPEPARQRRRGARQTLVGQFVAALRDADLRGLVVAFFLVSVAFSGVQVMFIPFAADIYGYDETQTALLLTYIGVLGVVNQGVVVGRLSRRVAESRIAIAGASLLLVALAAIPFSPQLGALLPAVGGPPYLTRELLALLVVLAALSLGNGLLNVALTTLVSIAASAETQGSAFGVTQGAGSLGRTVGPPTMAALYALVAYWSPFVAGAVLLLPVVGLLVGVVRLASVPAR